MNFDRVDALLKVLEQDPDDHAIRLMLAEAYAEAGEDQEALEHYDILLRAGKLPAESLVPAGMLALGSGRAEMASRCVDAAREAGLVKGLAELEDALNQKLASLGILRPVLASGEEAPAWAGDLFLSGPKVTFQDVGGLADVKKTIHRKIILPFQRPDLYQKYGRQAGGAVMLYGPPGCGKTLLARATAGECDLPFLNIRIEDVLDPYLGISERNLHLAFETARQSAPCVVFIDELDALAYARKKQQGSAGRAIVDQLLQELDAIGAENTNLLVIGATNAPWDVDDALKRPGRLDKTVFVPPPDTDARYEILKIVLKNVPAASIDLKRMAKSTPLFSGADLRALVEQAIDLVIDEALDTGREKPVSTEHIEQILPAFRPSTLEWLASARNYVEFANQAGQYDEVSAFLRSKEAKKWREAWDG